jgi:hypothetical protein
VGITDEKSLNKLRRYIDLIKDLKDAHKFNYHTFLVYLSPFIPLTFF